MPPKSRFDTFPALDLYSLDYVVGGLDSEEDETSGFDGGFDGSFDGSFDGGFDGSSGFDDGGVGNDNSYDDTPIEIDVTGVDPASPYSEEELFDIRVDIMQNYQDSASPPQLYQGDVADCFVVATLNAIAATPEGQAYLESMIKPLGDGLNEVTFPGRDGEPITVIVSDSDLAGGSGSYELQVLELAYGVATGGNQDTSPYASLQTGNPADVLAVLGLGTGDVHDASAALGFQQGSEVWTLGTNGDSNALSAYGLVDNHAYTVLGSITHPISGETYLVVGNPWGTQQPLPIPESALGTVFVGGAGGQLPSTSTGDGGGGGGG